MTVSKSITIKGIIRKSVNYSAVHLFEA
jgi:hypothetical protein